MNPLTSETIDYIPQNVAQTKYKLTFMNASLNHVEYYQLQNGESIVMNSEDIENLYQQKTNDGETFTYK